MLKILLLSTYKIFTNANNNNIIIAATRKKDVLLCIYATFYLTQDNKYNKMDHHPDDDNASLSQHVDRVAYGKYIEKQGGNKGRMKKLKQIAKKNNLSKCDD